MKSYLVVLKRRFNSEAESVWQGSSLDRATNLACRLFKHFKVAEVVVVQMSPLHQTFSIKCLCPHHGVQLTLQDNGTLMYVCEACKDIITNSPAVFPIAELEANKVKMEP